MALELLRGRGSLLGSGVGDGLSRERTLCLLSDELSFLTDVGIGFFFPQQLVVVGFWFFFLPLCRLMCRCGEQYQRLILKPARLPINLSHSVTLTTTLYWEGCWEKA